MARVTQRRRAGLAADLARDEAGGVLIYVAVTAAVLLGFVGLALDTARLLTAHSEVQAAADAAALAAASQLDGLNTGSDERAAQAAQGALVSNDQHFGTGADVSGKVRIASVRFLASLPASDDTPIGASNVAAAGQEHLARFVEVTTEPVSVSTTLLRTLGVTAPATVRATAVAGLSSRVCRVAPFMVCNPQEDPALGGHVGASFNPDALVGAAIRAKTQGSGATWAPGAFGLLQPSAMSDDTLADVLATSRPDAGCFGSAVDVATGSKNGMVAQNLNVRFDIYAGATSKYVGVPDYRPDSNVTRGQVHGNGACGSDTAAGAAMPLDWVLRNNASARFGDGFWDCQSYWTANHPGAPLPAGCTANTKNPSRYQVYQLEKTQSPAYGSPTCSKPGLPDRRIVYVAVLNCVASGIHGNGEKNIPLVGFMKALLLGPAVSGTDTEVDFEVIDARRPGMGGDMLKDDVQLYR